MKKLLYLLFAIVAVVGCTKQIDFSSESLTDTDELKISAAKISSRSAISKDSWDLNDEIGVALQIEDETNFFNIYYFAQYKNETGAASSAVFAGINSDNQLSLNKEKGTIYAYYPYNSDAVSSAGVYSINTETSQDDILVSKTTGQTLDDAKTLAIEFKHALSLIEIQFVNNDEAKTPLTCDSLEAGLSSLSLTGGYDIINDKVINLGGNGGTRLDMSLVDEAMPTIFEALIIPQENELLGVYAEIDGSKYSVEPLLTSEQLASFESNSKYTIKLFLKEGELNIYSTEITGWEDKDAVGSVDRVPSGTAISPYIISTLDEYSEFIDEINFGDSKAGVYYKLGDNITLPNYNFAITGSFAGNLDGAGYTLTLESFLSPLFNTLASTATINRLVIDGSISSDDNVGAFAMTNNGLIINCINNASVTSIGFSAAGFVYSNAGNIVNSINTSAVASEMESASGFVCTSSANSSILGCYMSGTLSAETDSYDFTSDAQYVIACTANLGAQTAVDAAYAQTHQTAVETANTASYSICDWIVESGKLTLDFN